MFRCLNIHKRFFEFLIKSKKKKHRKPDAKQNILQINYEQIHTPFLVDVRRFISFWRHALTIAMSGSTAALFCHKLILKKYYFFFYFWIFIGYSCNWRLEQKKNIKKLKKKNYLRHSTIRLNTLVTALV